MIAQPIVRRLLLQDIDAVWPLVRQSRIFGPQARKADLARFLQDGLSSGLVAEIRSAPLGVLLYEIDLETVTLEVAALFVVPSARGRGLGSRLLAALAERLRAVSHGCIRAVVNERDLAAQLFLRANAFRAVRCLPGIDPDKDDDAYVFERIHHQSAVRGRPRRRAGG